MKTLRALTVRGFRLYGQIAHFFSRQSETPPYSCNCTIGYDGETCSDVDECSSGIASCNGTTQCLNTEGLYKYSQNWLLDSILEARFRRKLSNNQSVYLRKNFRVGF